MPQYSDLQLERIIKIQETTLAHTRRGVTQVWVYNNIIKHEHHISERAYSRYLALNAKAILKERQESK